MRYEFEIAGEKVNAEEFKARLWHFLPKLVLAFAKLLMTLIVLYTLYSDDHGYLLLAYVLINLKVHTRKLIKLP
jgi:hypothetical protein